MQIQPVQNSSIPQYPAASMTAHQPAAFASDPPMLSHPDQLHTITILQYPAMPNQQPDQTSMPPAMMMTSPNHCTSPSLSSGSSKEITVSDDQQGHASRIPLYRAATTGDWEAAKIILGAHEFLKTAIIGKNSETALHVAVGCGPRTTKFVKELLNILTPLDLETTNMDRHTALAIAAKVGNMEAAELLVVKNPNLPNISGGEFMTEFPVHHAAKFGHKKLLLFLFEVTTNNAYLDLGTPIGEQFLSDIIHTEFYDLALLVIDRNTSVRTRGPAEGLVILAVNPSAFSFGRDTNLLKWFVEKCVPDSVIKKNSITSATAWEIKLYHSLWKLCGKLVPQLNHTVERLLKYRHAMNLVSWLCEGERNVLDEGTIETNPILKFKLPLGLAASNGIHEIIKEVIKKCPDAISNYKDDNNHDLFGQAIFNRHDNVYNYLYELGDLYINTARHSLYGQGDNILHLAAYMAPPERLNLISGAASQMQHEVQWYKEIENLVPLQFRNSQNNDGLTPRDVFLQKHQKLMEEAESWMKGTANSCTVSAALIATVVFAAAITVPGGNSGESGVPMFAKNKAFIVFGVADAISLFTSCVSILMFLSILTSRYAEQDFLYALPKRLIIGLLALFVSIASMMVAFSATLYLVFGAHKLWILTSVVASAFLPVAIFASLQFSLLSEMISSTYGSSRFRSRRNTSFSSDKREEELQLLATEK